MAPPLDDFLVTLAYPFGGTLGGPLIEVRDLLCIDARLALGDDFGGEPLHIGEMTHLVLDRPSDGRRVPLPLACRQALEKLVQLLLFRDEV